MCPPTKWASNEHRPDADKLPIDNRSTIDRPSRLTGSRLWLTLCLNWLRFCLCLNSLRRCHSQAGCECLLPPRENLCSLTTVGANLYRGVLLASPFMLQSERV